MKPVQPGQGQLVSAAPSRPDTPNSVASRPETYGSERKHMVERETSRNQRWTRSLSDISFKSTPFGRGLVISNTYVVPTRILAKIFTCLDKQDSPAQPGRLKFSTAQSAIVRFHSVVGACSRESVQDCVDESIQDLYLHAAERAARMGIAPADALIRWNQDAVLKTFRVTVPFMERVYFTMDIAENSTIASKSVSFLLMTAVVVSVVTFVLGTLPAAKTTFPIWVPYADLTCVIIFTLDYGLRLLSVPFARMELMDHEFMFDVLTNKCSRQLLSPSKRLLRFVLSPMSFVDLMSVVPFWVEFAAIGGISGFMDEDALESQRSKSLKIVRMVRMFRILKLGSLTKVDLGENRNMVVTLFTTVVMNAWPALQLVVVLIMVALVLFGTLIWYAERGDLFEQDDFNCPHIGLCRDGAIHLRAFPDGTYEQQASPFSSIPMSFWWVIITITTVGYGDMYPITPWGYCVGVLTTLYGAVVFALPVGVIGTTFSQAFEEFRAEQSLRKLLVERDAAHDSTADVASEDAKHSLSFDELPPVVSDLQVKLQSLATTVAVPCGLVQRWEEQLKAVIQFENLSRDHPCESLERWGSPVIALLREHASQSPVGGAALSLTLASWYRLLLHTAECFEDFRCFHDRAAFMRSFHGPMGKATAAKESAARFDSKDSVCF